MTSSSADARERVTIVVPVYNRAGRLLAEARQVFLSIAEAVHFHGQVRQAAADVLPLGLAAQHLIENEIGAELGLGRFGQLVEQKAILGECIVVVRHVAEVIAQILGGLILASFRAGLMGPLP